MNPQAGKPALRATTGNCASEPGQKKLVRWVSFQLNRRRQTNAEWNRLEATQPLPQHYMKYGARNKISAKVTSVQSDQIMSLVKFEVAVPIQMASVLTTESVQELGLKVGDTVQLGVKAIHVLPVKE